MNQAKPTLMKENILIAVMCLLYPVIPIQGQQRDSTLQTRPFKTHFSREITGIVVDDTGEPLAGATITSVGEDGNRATTMMVWLAQPVRTGWGKIIDMTNIDAE